MSNPDNSARQQRDLLARLGVRYPIIQAPMLGVSTPEMAAAVSNAGGLGSLAIGGLSPDDARSLIRKTRSLTSLPFAVNLFAHDVPAYNEPQIEPMKQFLLQFAESRNYTLDEKDLTGFRFFTYRDQVNVLLEENVKLISFTFGIPDDATLTTLRSNGCLLMGTATCIEEGLLLAERLVDVVVAQGIEAGGHRGTFVDTVPLPQVGLFALVPQLCRKLSLPVVAAGGINNGATMQAAFALGAAAVQVGTPFIATRESAAIAAYQQRVLAATGNDTALTRGFSGRWARGLTNAFMKEVEDAGIPIPPYPIQNSLTGKLRKLAQATNDADTTNLWSGQAPPVLKGKSTGEIFEQLVAALQPIP